MRILGGAVVLLLAGGSPLLALQEQNTEELILELQKKIAELEETVNDLKKDEAEPQPSAGLEDQLDDVLQNPSEPLLEPSRLNFTAPGLDNVTWSGGFRWRGTWYDRYKPPGSRNNNAVLTFDQRLNLGIGARLSEKTELYVELHDGRIWGNNGAATPTAAKADSFEISSVYIDMADVYSSGFDLRVGHQPIALGRERILGDDEWLNTPFRHDGIVGTSELADGMTLLVAGVRVADGDNVSATEIGPGLGGGNTDLYIAYLSNDLGDMGVVEPYIMLLDSDVRATGAFPPGQNQFFTYGVRWAADMDMFWWDGEFATQFGEFANSHDNDYGFDRIGISVEAGVNLTDGDDGMASGVYVAYDYATGGRNDTFAPLLPSLHGWFGAMDVIGWSNVEHTAIGARLGVGDGTLDISWRWLGLENSNGFWAGYNSAGAGGGDDEVGQELDFVYSVPCGDNSNVDIAFAYLFPGDAYKNSYGTSSGTAYSYITYGLSF